MWMNSPLRRERTLLKKVLLFGLSLVDAESGEIGRLQVMESRRVSTAILWITTEDDA
jgi:hypothetical protein